MGPSGLEHPKSELAGWQVLIEVVPEVEKRKR
jgi:hypothetical protein